MAVANFSWDPWAENNWENFIEASLPVIMMISLYKYCCLAYLIDRNCYGHEKVNYSLPFSHEI